MCESIASIKDMHHADVAVAGTPRGHERRTAVEGAAGSDSHDTAGVLVVLGSRLWHSIGKVDGVERMQLSDGQCVSKSDVD